MTATQVKLLIKFRPHYFEVNGTCKTSRECYRWAIYMSSGNFFLVALCPQLIWPLRLSIMQICISSKMRFRDSRKFITSGPFPLIPSVPRHCNTSAIYAWTIFCDNAIISGYGISGRWELCWSFLDHHLLSDFYCHGNGQKMKRLRLVLQIFLFACYFMV